MSPAIRTRTLRSLYVAIKPSRMLTLRTADCLHSSLATKNFRSISIGRWCSCSFGRSDVSRTDAHSLMEVLNSGSRLQSINRSMIPTSKLGQMACRRRTLGAKIVLQHSFKGSIRPTSTVIVGCFSFMAPAVSPMCNGSHHPERIQQRLGRSKLGVQKGRSRMSRSIKQK